jgi:hypothetical protein
VGNHWCGIWRYWPRRLKKMEKVHWNLWAYPQGHGIDLFISKENKPTQAVYDNAHELKVIIFNKHDFVFAEEQAKK